MKKLILFLFLITAVSLHLAGQVIISLTYTAETNGIHQTTDSILIENLTQGGDTTLYGTDTVLVLAHGIGIEDNMNAYGNPMILFPAFPNPVTHTSTIRLWLPQDEPVTLRLYDLIGRELATFSRTLGAGEHAFIFTPGKETYYLLVAEAANERHVQKIINLSPGDGTCRLSYAGHQPAVSGMKRGRAVFPWVPGDSLRFIGYASLGVDTIVDHPTHSANYTFQYSISPYPPGTIHCDPSNPTAVADVTNPTTGKIWMDRNLGASQVATSTTDALAYGDLYQWGRFADGHQCRTSPTTTTISATDHPGHNSFITNSDWRNPQNHFLWLGVNGANNPCPTGYRLPSEAELNDERLSWSSNNAAGAFASPLKLTIAGYRDYTTGGLMSSGAAGHYWSSGIQNSTSHNIAFGNGTTPSWMRGNGFSVRCIKDFSTPALPTQPSSINGPANPCENTTGLIYSVTQETGVTYMWIVPSGWSITAGQGTHEISVTSGASSGIIEVTPSNITGYGPCQTFIVTTHLCSTGTYPIGYVHCGSGNPTAVVDATNPTTGKTWMDRNLGAYQAATTSTDSLAYGDLHQWGRFADGHQCRTSTTTFTLSWTSQPGHSNFILAPNMPHDWRSPQNTHLWQGLNGENNTCPDGYRLPTEAELDAERLSWSSNNASGAFDSPIKLTLAGHRTNGGGSLGLIGSAGYYWSSTISGTGSLSLGFNNTGTTMYSTSRAYGHSVRCIKAVAPPSQPSPINGLPNPCANDTGLDYNVTQVAGVTYTWTVPTGWSITQGQGTHEITVTAGTDPGTVVVVPSNHDGFGPAQVLAVTLHCYPQGYVFCNPSNPTAVVNVTNPTTGKIWMDRNLGASQAASTSTDSLAYGDLYQWGRFADGHQCRTSTPTTTLSTTDQPGHGYFILTPTIPNNDWRNPQNDSLWQGVNGINNPCPYGYRLPTETELNFERMSWNGNNASGAFASPLKLPVAGTRSYYSDTLYSVGAAGYYWAHTVWGTTSYGLTFYGSNAYTSYSPRANGKSVRCIKD